MSGLQLGTKRTHLLSLSSLPFSRKLVSESAQGCNVTVDVSRLDSLQTQRQQLGGAHPPFLLLPEPAGSSQLWQLHTALLVASCGFSPLHSAEEQFSCLGQGLATFT